MRIEMKVSNYPKTSRSIRTNPGDSAPPSGHERKLTPGIPLRVAIAGPLGQFVCCTSVLGGRDLGRGGDLRPFSGWK